MQTLISPQTLVQQLRSASAAEPCWLLLQPGVSCHQRLWTSESSQFSSPEKSLEIARAIAQVPEGGQPATLRSFWVANLMALIFPTSQKEGDSVVLPIINQKRVVACVGRTRRVQQIGDVKANAQRVRDVIRTHWRIGQVEAENQALHWMVRCSDRPVAYARRDGTLRGANPMAAELLMRAQHGDAHHFHPGEPTLPEKLARAVLADPVGQVRLNAHCTARFEELPQRSVFAPPIVGIEFFVEAPNQMPHPISRLTPVERVIRDLICAGLTNREIAERRGCAQATVKNQVSSILSKLGLSRRQHLLLPPRPLPAVQLLSPGTKGVTALIK